MLIFSVETSCDETAVALVSAQSGKFTVIDEIVSSQIKLHAPFGGVVPNLAAREHLKNLPILIQRIFDRNNFKISQVDLIAATQGPGLIPALLIGTNAAKSLSYSLKLPLVGVHHIEGHIYANFIRKARNSKLKSQTDEMKFPLLALIVSGGHTQLILVKKHLDYQVIGETLDDAAGEAFDKVAKILHLGYPGGPEISKLAENIQNSRFKKASSMFNLPRPMITSKNLNFSFSGLKTSVLYTVRDNPKILRSKRLKSELSAEFQQAVIDVLINKTIQAAKLHKPRTIILGGGVSANTELRKQLGTAIKDNLPKTVYELPEFRYSLDNATMIAIAGYYRYDLSKNKRQFMTNWKTMEANASLRLDH